MKPLALVIDRDAGTRKLLDVLLTRFGYEVDRVALTPDGITLLGLVDYDFVLAEDEAVARWLAAHRPEMLERMMIVSAATDAQLQRMWSEWSSVRIVRKPFELADVIDAARAAAGTCERGAATAEELFWRQSIISGAKSGILVRRRGDQLDLATHFGYEPGAVESYFPLQLSDLYPIAAAVRHGRPVWLASLATTPEYPLLASVWRRHHSRALAAVPVFHGRDVIGAAGWTFREPQRFSDVEQHGWLAIGQATAPLVARGVMLPHPVTQAGA